MCFEILVLRHFFVVSSSCQGILDDEFERGGLRSRLRRIHSQRRPWTVYRRCCLFVFFVAVIEVGVVFYSCRVLASFCRVDVSASFFDWYCGDSPSRCPASGFVLLVGVRRTWRHLACAAGICEPLADWLTILILHSCGQMAGGAFARASGSSFQLMLAQPEARLHRSCWKRCYHHLPVFVSWT